MFISTWYRYKDDELILGASRSVHFNAKIDNNGEDAHQAVLNVYHPTDVKFERVEVEAVSYCNFVWGMMTYFKIFMVVESVRRLTT